MFCLYFTEGPVRSLADAKQSDTVAFARYFHASLRAGFLLRPIPVRSRIPLHGTHTGGTGTDIGYRFQDPVRILEHIK
jgi:glutamate-1-semialdehyde aminotransferase